MQKYEIPQNCPFSLPFPTVIAFHRVKKSPLIIEIKINGEQPHPFSESELFIPYFLQIVPITYVCFVYFAAIAQVCINFHRQHVWQWWCERGAKSHVSKEISGRGRTRSRGVKGNQGVGDFRFINILQFFSIYYYYYYYYFLSFFPYFFTHDIYPHPHPRPTTSTHYPRPTTFSYTPTDARNTFHCSINFVLMFLLSAIRASRSFELHSWLKVC